MSSTRPLIRRRHFVVRLLHRGFSFDELDSVPRGCFSHFFSRAPQPALVFFLHVRWSLFFFFFFFFFFVFVFQNAVVVARARPRRPRRPPFVSSLATRAAFFYRLSSTTQRVPRLAFSPLASSPRRASPRGWFSVSFPPL